MPNRKLLTLGGKRRKLATDRLAATAVIGFSLTFVAAGVALLMGWVPTRLVAGMDPTDATVVLLFVPLCALTLAILAEAVRATTSDGLQVAKPETADLHAWRPGHGEG